MVVEKYKTLITASKYYILKLYLTLPLIYTYISCITSINKIITNSWKELKKTINHLLIPKRNLYE